MDLAAELGKTTQEVKALTTGLEFHEWVCWFKRRLNKREKLDYYLAQIALEVCRGNVKHPNKIKLQNFLVNFQTKSSSRNVRFSKEERLALSKAHWFGATGLAGRTKPKRK